MLALGNSPDLGIGRPSKVEDPGVVVVAERKSRGDGGSVDVRQRLHRVEASSEVGSEALGIAPELCHWRRVQLEREHAFGSDAGRHLRDPLQAADQQACANEQRQRKRDLGDDQKVADPEAAEEGARCAPAVL